MKVVITLFNKISIELISLFIWNEMERNSKRLRLGKKISKNDSKLIPSELLSVKWKYPSNDELTPNFEKIT